MTSEAAGSVRALERTSCSGAGDTTLRPPLSGVDPRRLLDCVHCGLCLSACPTYLELGTEMDSPRGRIYLMRDLQAHRTELTKEVVRHLDLCLGCRACETACPSGVRYGALIEEARSYVAECYRRPWWERTWRRLLAEIFPYPARLRALLVPVRALQAVRVWQAAARIPLAGLLPALGPRLVLPEVSPAHGSERARVGLLRGCVASELFARTNLATVRVLNRNGVTVTTPREAGCCGALHLHAGDRGAAQACARRVMNAFPSGLHAVVVNAAGCGAAMKEYGDLFRDDPEQRERAAAFAAKVRDITEYLISLPLREPNGVVSHRLTYHDACHLAHGQGVRSAPRALLKLLPGVELVDLPESDLCCGSAGTYNLVEPAMSRRLLKRKIDNIVTTRATCVAAANPGCSLQIQAGLTERGLLLRVAHPVELLDEAYEGEG